MAAYERLDQEPSAPSGDRSAADFAARHAADTAEFVTRRWPGTREAEAAMAVLVRYAIRNDRVEDAQRLLANVSAESRPQLEMQLGSSMWTRCLELAQRDESARPSEAEIRQIREAATEYLRHGVDAARTAGRIDEATAAATIYLAQALLSQSDYKGATALLEDEKSGPLALVARQHPSVSRPGFAIQVYETALRAYVAATPPRTQKVLETMKLLEQAIDSSGGQLADQLTRVYVGLGVQLQQQIEQLREAGRDEDATRVAAALAQFADRIAARKEGLNWTTRQWLAQTYFHLGAAASDGSTTKPQTAREKEYLTKARDIYQNLLGTANSANPQPAEAALVAAKFQLGECYRELGQFEQALDTFSAVLADRESTLAVQRAAALAYQQRGQAGGSEWFERAIFGGYKLKTTGENRVWGWLKLSQVADRAARSDPKFRDTFFEARVNIACCRYLAAMQQEGEARKQSLSHARQNIQSVARAYPDLGGTRWKTEFDELSKQVDAAESGMPSGTKTSAK
jgi:tetratricopeptide (TPR) repeat protein